MWQSVMKMAFVSFRRAHKAHLCEKVHNLSHGSFGVNDTLMSLILVILKYVSFKDPCFLVVYVSTRIHGSSKWRGPKWGKWVCIIYTGLQEKHLTCQNEYNISLSSRWHNVILVISFGVIYTFVSLLVYVGSYVDVPWRCQLCKYRW